MSVQVVHVRRDRYDLYFGWRLVTDSYPLGWRCLEHRPIEETSNEHL